MKNNITILEIAREAGVSPATVSRVNNNHPKISPETVRKVREASERLGFELRPFHLRQNHTTIRRRKYRQMQIALLSRLPVTVLNAPIYSRVIRGVEEELSEHDYNMILRNFKCGQPFSKLPPRIDGAILFALSGEDPRFIRALREIPCVRIMGLPRENDFFDHITYNDDAVGRRAAEYLWNRGHRVFLCIRSTFPRREESFCRTVLEKGGRLETLQGKELIVETGETQLANVRELGTLLEEMKTFPVLPTAIFAPVDIIMLGLYQTLPHYGLVPGKDVEIIGVNNELAFLKNLNPRPASVDIQPERIGRAAVRRLLWRIDNRNEPLTKLELDPEIIQEN